MEEKTEYSPAAGFEVQRLPDYTASQFEPIAITGLGCIFPDSLNVPSFWKNILTKKDSIAEVPEDRWNLEVYYDPDPTIPKKTYTKIGGFVTDFKFDPISFRIPPRSVDRIDDLQLWTLTAVKQAWEDAGYQDKDIDRTRVGVIIGNAQGGEYRDLSGKRIHFLETLNAIRESEILKKLSSEEEELFIQELEDKIMGDYPSINEDTMPGELSNIIPARVTNIFDFKGPNFTTDAACASSLAAIDMAVKGLQCGDIDIAITGGADRSMNPPTYVKFCKIGVLSSTGSRPFDSGADGFVMGEGAGILILKRLTDAMKDGDKIYAVIRGIGSSSDGKGKGITAPNPKGQAQAINMAYEKAGYDPGTVSLIEAHGTSTIVGDAVELKTLADIWSETDLGKRTVGIGSIKSQIGHLKGAAGAAGMIKMIMAIHNRTLPPTINYNVPNPKIDLGATPFFVVKEGIPWNQPVINSREFPRRGGVSAFGFGGSNFHVALEEYTGKYPVMAPSIPPSSALTVQKGGLRETMGSGMSGIDLNEYLEINANLEGCVISLSAPTADKLKGMIADVKQRLENSSKNNTFRLSDFAYDINKSNSSCEVICHRLAIAAPNAKEMLARMQLSLVNIDDRKRMFALEARGISYNDPDSIEPLIMNGEDTPRIGFIFPGQGSQYLNMLRDLSEKYRVVKDTFEESDNIMTGIIGRPLTDIIFSHDDESEEVKKEKIAQLRKTEITQPAMITGDIAIYRLLKQFGVEPTAVAGHSLGEYGALVASGVMDFASALMAVAVRGREMANVRIDDKGKMASVAAGEDVIQEVLDSIGGYAIIANKNSYRQSVIAGNSKTVDEAVAKLNEIGITTIMLPVSHAFHSEIVAPAKEPLGRVLRGIEINAPAIPTLTNVHGGLYPTEGDVKEKVVEILVEQIAGAVEWVKEMEIMYNDLGVRTFLEVGTKRALTSAVQNIFSDRPHKAFLTNHPKKGGIQTFNEALAGLSSCGIPIKWHGTDDAELYTDTFINAGKAIRSKDRPLAGIVSGITSDMLELVELGRKAKALALYLDRIVITGAGLGLPGKFKKVFDEKNADLILDGVNLIDTIEKDYRKKFLDKNIVKLVKTSSGQAHFETIVDDSDVVKLAGQAGRFDLHEEYGVEKELVKALDVSTQLAIAAGLEAMRDAGIPLVRKYNLTSTGNYLPGNWELPEEMQEDTAVIFSTTFPGYDRLFELTSKYYIDKYGPRAKRELMNLYASLITRITDEDIKRELTDGFADLYSEYSREMDETDVYEYNRKFMLNVLSIGHAQFAQFINARGPNIHNNAACATTTQAVGIAEDMLRTGRCKRVILISGDAPTSKYNMEWLVTSLLANGAATIEGDLEEAALPFDRRRKGLIVGMGAAAMVFERAEDVAERGMDPIVELMGTYAANSAYHATRLDTAHVASEMNHFFERLERRHGFRREHLVDDMVFISHETYTPARGGSSNAEKDALEGTFGDNFRKILVTNTKGFTGHAFGCGIEDVIALRLLQKGKVPPIANYKVPDPYLEGLRLSMGVEKYFKYALRFSAGFGSQIAMTLTKIVNTDEFRIIDRNVYGRWLARMSGQRKVELEIVNRTLRIKDDFSLSARETREAVHITPPPVEPKALPQAPIHTAPSTPAYTTSPTPIHTAPSTPAYTTSPTSVHTAPPAPTPGVPSPSVPVTMRSDPISETVISIVSEKTGYPTDMLELDLDMEADLGIDTVKQVELFGAIREHYGVERDEGVNLSDYPTIRSVVGYIADRLGVPLTEEVNAAPVPQYVEKAPVQQAGEGFTPTIQQAKETLTAPAGEIEKVLIGIVSEKTGYPPDMLELDLDMEADLGIDTVKQVELFGAIRDHYGLERDEGVNLSEYPTIGSVAEYVANRLGVSLTEGISAVPSTPSIAPSTAHPTASTPPVITVPVEVPQEGPRSPAAAIEKLVISIVSEKTGYPPDMLEADLDMEADLGIDTVKQVELFGAIRDHYGLERDEGVNLSEYPTIGSVVGYIADRLGVPLTEGISAVPSTPPTAPSKAHPTAPSTAHPTAPSTAHPTAPSTAPPTASTPPVITIPVEVSQEGARSPATEIEKLVIDIVSEKTGYPPDMLEADLDMEADLGIDTVKQVELFGAIRDHYGLERDEGVNLSEYPTIGSVVNYISKKLDAEKPPAVEPSAAAVEMEANVHREPEEGQKEDIELKGEARDLRRYLTRFVPGALADKKRYDFEGMNIIIVMDERDVGKKLKTLIKKKGANVIEYRYTIGKESLRKGSYRFDLADYDKEIEVLEKVHDGFGKVGGVFYLQGMDEEIPLEKMNYDDWKAATAKKVKSLFALAKAVIGDLNDSSSDKGSFILSAVEMGGSFGIEGDVTFNTPVQGGITGLMKALGKEMTDVLVKSMDIGELATPNAAAKLVLREIEYGDGRLEVCYKNGERKIAQMYHEPADRTKEPNVRIDGDWVFIIPGGGFGITAEIAKDLAEHYRPKMVILDIVKMPDNIEEIATLDEKGMAELKNRLFGEMKEGGARVTPVMLEREFRKYTMPRIIFNNMKEMRALGAEVEFHSADVTDHDRMKEVIGEVRERYGRIDCIIHAAGIEISKLLTDKPPEQFAFVFDVKANGAFNLFELTREDELKAFVTFSSVAGRFGNIGQTDYSSANDLLNKYMDLNRKRYGDRCKAISTNWTGWRGVGMATRGSLLKIFDDAGVTLIPLDYGRKKVREELLYSGAENEVTIAGNVAFLDADKIILPDGMTKDAWDLQQFLEENRSEYPLIDRIEHCEKGTKIIAGKHLDHEIDLYLADHSIADTPYLPGVMGVEIFAETSRLFFPEMHPVAIEDVVFAMPIKLLRKRPMDIRIICEAQEATAKRAVVNVTVESDFINPQGIKMGEPRIHFTGRVILKDGRQKAKKLKPLKIPKGEAVKFDEVYERFFHGPTFQVLGGMIKIAGKMKKGARSWGKFREPVGDFFSFTPDHSFASGPMFREFGFQTCGMLDIYHRANMSLPNGIKRIELFDVPKTSKGFISRIVYNGETGDGPMKITHYDVEIMDEKGNIIDRMTDYEMINTGKIPEEKRF